MQEWLSKRRSPASEDPHTVFCVSCSHSRFIHSDLGRSFCLYSGCGCGGWSAPAIGSSRDTNDWTASAQDVQPSPDGERSSGRSGGVVISIRDRDSPTDGSVPSGGEI